MSYLAFDMYDVRFEISFKSFDELRSILAFYQSNNLNKINIPCKNNLKKDFLLNSIKTIKEEFPSIDLIPHFSVSHEFKRNKTDTQNSLINFLKVIKCSGCKEVLLVSGSQKRSTLDSLSTLNFLQDNPLYCSNEISIGVAFNPYLPSFLFDNEILRLEKKLQSGLISSIWFQFGSDYKLFNDRLKILNSILDSTIEKRKSDINLYGSILIPSKQFLARFKFRPWKGVYCSDEFLDSVDFAKNQVRELLNTYKQNNIFPIIETSVYTNKQFKILNEYLSSENF